MAAKQFRRSDLADEPDTAFLTRIAADTWRSMVAMVDPATGLPADGIGADLDPAGRTRYTSPTNIGAFLWSSLAAQRLGLITRSDAVTGATRVLRTLSEMERHEPSGMFYHWYDERTGQKLVAMPNGETVEPFLSSVDNAWLATGLLALSGLNTALGVEADRLRDTMNFGAFYDPVERQIRGGFWLDDGPDRVAGDYLGTGGTVHYTGHLHGTFNAEPRMATYLGIAAGQIPPEAYYTTLRDRPERTPTWPTRVYHGVRVHQGTVQYRGMRIVPTWGGSMFEALMVPLFVPEEHWGPRSWGINHPLYVRAQIEHGLAEAGYGYWGFSPSNNPAGGYRTYGVHRLALDAEGYTSDQERTRAPDSGHPTQFGDGVVTPHASFLAMRYAPAQTMANLRKLLRNFDSYGPGGFYDSIAVRSGQVSRRYLSLDQGMTMAALGNRLGSDVMRTTVSGGSLRVLRPLMAAEVFASAPRP